MSGQSFYRLLLGSEGGLWLTFGDAGILGTNQSKLLLI